MAAGDVFTIDFHLQLPEFYPSSFSFSPAIADGTLDSNTVCDWIDNAIVLQMSPAEGQVYGYVHVPCRVELNRSLATPSTVAPLPAEARKLVEFTGERVIPGQVNEDLWSEHVARYAFARRIRGGTTRSRRRLRSRLWGGGTGANRPESVTGMDMAPEAVAFARANYSEAWFALPARPHAPRCLSRPNGFDVVVAFEVIEHCQDYRAFLDECARVLQPPGLLHCLLAQQALLRRIARKTGPNPYHEHEFEAEEFVNELSRLFLERAVAVAESRGILRISSQPGRFWRGSVHCWRRRPSRRMRTS